MKEDAKKVLRSVVVGGPGAIPGVGGIISSLLDTYIPRAVTDKKQKFLDEVEAGLNDISDDGKELILRNESFQAIFLKAFRSSLEEVEKEKINCFKNIILNSAKELSFDYDKKSMFISFVRDLTTRQIVLLKSLRAPEETLKKNDKKLNIISGGISSYLKLVISEFDKEKEFYLYGIQDLQNKGLLQRFEVGVTMTLSGVLTKRTSSMGDEFLEFITL